MKFLHLAVDIILGGDVPRGGIAAFRRDISVFIPSWKCDELMAH